MSQTDFAALQSSCFSIKSLLVLSSLFSFVSDKTSERSFRKARSALNDCYKDSVMSTHTHVMAHSPEIKGRKSHVGAELVTYS